MNVSRKDTSFSSMDSNVRLEKEASVVCVVVAADSINEASPKPKGTSGDQAAESSSALSVASAAATASVGEEVRIDEGDGEVVEEMLAP